MEFSKEKAKQIPIFRFYQFFSWGNSNIKNIKTNSGEHKVSNDLDFTKFSKPSVRVSRVKSFQTPELNIHCLSFDKNVNSLDEFKIQSFLCFYNLSDDKIYQFTRLVIGLKTAPFIATRSLQLVLNQENFQEFINTLEETSIKAALRQLKL